MWRFTAIAAKLSPALDLYNMACLLESTGDDTHSCNLLETCSHINKYLIIICRHLILSRSIKHFFEVQQEIDSLDLATRHGASMLA